MKRILLAVALVAVASPLLAEDGASIADDFRPSSLNQLGREYPQVNSQGYARFRIEAPEAQSVRVTLGGREGTDGFRDRVKLVFSSCGGREYPDRINANHEALVAAGVPSTAYVSPDTGHEFQSWRRSLHELAPLLFRD